MRPTLCSALRSLSTAGYFTVLLCSAQAQSGVVREKALSTVDTPTHVAPGMQLPSGKVVRVDLGHPQCLTDEVFALIDAEADANVAAVGHVRSVG